MDLFSIRFMLFVMLLISFRVSDEGNLLEVHPPITTIAAYSKGFACACGHGTVYLYEKTDDKDFFKRTREIRVRNLARLRS